MRHQGPLGLACDYPLRQFGGNPPNSAIVPGGNLGGILRGPPGRFRISGGAEQQRRKASNLLGRFEIDPGE